LIYFFDYKSPFLLRKPQIPLYKWLLPVTLYFAVSVLNNRVWIYDISIPVHIIFRSGGTVTTMAVGYLVGKRYTVRQILGVATLTIGVCVATLYGRGQASNDSVNSSGCSIITESQGEIHIDSTEVENDVWGILSPENITFLTGISQLTIAAVLTAVQGLVAESLYSKYGRHWRESLFYTHFISLAFFLPISSDLIREFKVLANSQPRYDVFGIFTISQQIVNLILNAVTQYVCVRGVNNLAGQVQALTVTIVLNIRKFISLLLSVYLFGNDLSVGMVLGTALVFSGAFLYSWK
jgi:solute carrier family 35 (UDP-xylose/UDP-N-acetylglucosamine transporter), member B4